MTNGRRTGIALALLGVAAIASPFLAWPNYGQTPYQAHFFASDDQSVDAGEVIAYGDLPPAARQAFDSHVGDGSPGTLYGERHADSLRALRDHDYVRHEGTLYRIRLGAQEDSWILVSILRNGLFLLGGALTLAGLAVGLVRGRRSRNGSG